MAVAYTIYRGDYGEATVLPINGVWLVRVSTADGRDRTFYRGPSERSAYRALRKRAFPFIGR
jgi:hypothetical protein